MRNFRKLTVVAAAMLIAVVAARYGHFGIPVEKNFTW
jgi:hypothetical protein